MSTTRLSVMKSRMLLTALATIGWWVMMLCWMVFAWSRYNVFQTLVGLGIVTLLYAAVAGVLWTAEQGYTLAATILATMGGLSFALYWMAFAWGQHTLLQNGGVLVLSFLVWLSSVAAFWLVGPWDQTC